MLMDRVTLEAHRVLWGKEDTQRRLVTDLPELTGPEQSLYRLLCDNSLADNLRLEQEHIRHTRLKEQHGSLQE
jgi:hypothetical protein